MNHLVLLVVAALSVPVRSQHVCERECKEDQTMVCKYDFEVDMFYTMHSTLCRGCPDNQTACFQPGCLTGVGCKRGLITINRQMPGPLINVCEGDEIEVKVTNRLGTETITIHWHGIHQRGTQCMDGVPLVTQFSIPPTGIYVYRFVATEPGTHFYHSHSGFQKDDGMYGPLIIRQVPGRDPNEGTYTDDLVREHNIIVMDWAPQTTYEYYLGALMSDAPNYEMVVNGRGKALSCNDSDGETPRPTFWVRQGRSYRFRFISNGFGLCPIEVSFDSHSMLAIASDGKPLQPTPIGRFQFNSGERFDVVINANQTPGAYWIKFKGLLFCEDIGRTYQYAILRYEGTSETEMPTAPDDYDSAGGSGVLLNPSFINETETQITMAQIDGLNTGADESILIGPPDRTLYVTFDDKSFDPSGYNAENFPIQLLSEPSTGYVSTPLNNISFAFPRYPVIMDEKGTNEYCDAESMEASNGCSSSNAFCQCTQLNRTQYKEKRHEPYSEVVEIIYYNLGSFKGVHPLHLHGYSCFVTAVGEIDLLNELQSLNENGSIPKKTTRAVQKDTFTVAQKSYVVTRFRADNPGIWALHCHISIHSEAGMFMLFQVGDLKRISCRSGKKGKKLPLCGGYPREHVDDHKLKVLLYD